MNYINRLLIKTILFLVYAVGFFAMLVYGSWVDDDTAMAQAVDDDHYEAMQMARDKAECRARLGNDSAMYLMDGQLVCRAKKAKNLDSVSSK